MNGVVYFLASCCVLPRAPASTYEVHGTVDRENFTVKKIPRPHPPQCILLFVHHFLSSLVRKQKKKKKAGGLVIFK